MKLIEVHFEVFRTLGLHGSPKIHKLLPTTTMPKRTNTNCSLIDIPAYSRPLLITTAQGNYTVRTMYADPCLKKSYSFGESTNFNWNHVVGRIIRNTGKPRKM